MHYTDTIGDIHKYVDKLRSVLYCGSLLSFITDIIVIKNMLLKELFLLEHLLQWILHYLIVVYFLVQICSLQMIESINIIITLY